MSAFETLRPIMEKYIVEPDSLQTAFDEPTTDLFSLGMDSMGAFALLDDLAAEGAVIEFTEGVQNPTGECSAPRRGKALPRPAGPPAAKAGGCPGCLLLASFFFAQVLCRVVWLRLPLSAHFCQRTSVSVKRRGSSLPFTHRISSLIQTPNPDL